MLYLLESGEAMFKVMYTYFPKGSPKLYMLSIYLVIKVNMINYTNNNYAWQARSHHASHKAHIGLCNNPGNLLSEGISNCIHDVSVEVQCLSIIYILDFFSRFALVGNSYWFVVILFAAALLSSKMSLTATLILKLDF